MKQTTRVMVTVTHVSAYTDGVDPDFVSEQTLDALQMALLRGGLDLEDAKAVEVETTPYHGE